MKIEITGEAKEIAALVLAVQERQEVQEVEVVHNIFDDAHRDCAVESGSSAR